jgi:hypothetical protein
VVTVGGVASNRLSFTVTSPAITSMSPISGPGGMQVTISGAAFGSVQGTGAVAGQYVWYGGQLEQHTGGCHGQFPCYVRNRPGATERTLVHWCALHRS